MVFQQRNLPLDAQTRLFETPEVLLDALKHGEVDAVSMLTDQFLGLEPALQPEAVFISTKNREPAERYVLLVHRTSSLTNVSRLPARSLLLQTSARTGLAPHWLEVLFARHSLGSPETVLKSLTRLESSSKPVLQVFFRQADACVVTASVFELACELNPQLRKELVVLAASPPVIPVLFFFPPAFKAKLRGQLEEAILALPETLSGQQVLTVFQGDGMLKLPVSALEESRRLLAEHERLKRDRGTGVADAPTVPITNSQAP
jgi:phosphonate transport system substrate-binding protein